MSAKSDPRPETERAGSQFYYRRSLSAGELLPAIVAGAAAGFVAFWLTRVALQRTPLAGGAGSRDVEGRPSRAPRSSGG